MEVNISAKCTVSRDRCYITACLTYKQKLLLMNLTILECLATFIIAIIHMQQKLYNSTLDVPLKQPSELEFSHSYFWHQSCISYAALSSFCMCAK